MLQNHARRSLHCTSKRLFNWRDSMREGAFSADVHENKPTHIIVGAGSAGCVLGKTHSKNAAGGLSFQQTDWLKILRTECFWSRRVRWITGGTGEYTCRRHSCTTCALTRTTGIIIRQRRRIWAIECSTGREEGPSYAQKIIDKKYFQSVGRKFDVECDVLRARTCLRLRQMGEARGERVELLELSTVLQESRDVFAFKGRVRFVPRKQWSVARDKRSSHEPAAQGMAKCWRSSSAWKYNWHEWREAGRHFHNGHDNPQWRTVRISILILRMCCIHRWSASKAYLHPILNRPNLITSSGITCTRVLFDKNKAIGIEFIRKLNFVGTDSIDSYSREKIYCQGDVILSGGSINTPQILMLSGVGPAAHLRSHEIPLIADVPGVGQNLQDHLEIYVQQECTQPVTLYNKSSWKFPHNMIKIGLEWFTNRTGLGASSHLETGGFARSDDTVSHPDIQFHFLPSTVHDDGRTNGTCHGYQVWFRSTFMN